MATCLLPELHLTFLARRDERSPMFEETDTRLSANLSIPAKQKGISLGKRLYLAQLHQGGGSFKWIVAKVHQLRMLLMA